MGLTKTDFFTDKQNSIATMTKALGHPARIAIMEHLLKVNACIGGDIVEHIGLAQATISQHLKELKAAGLIKGSIEGTSVCYCIDEKGVGKMAAYFTNITKRLESRNEKCC